eukprot:COSAG06_NODE_22146_length_732_cov_3.515008_1_plen_64_part_10
MNLRGVAYISLEQVFLEPGQSRRVVLKLPHGAKNATSCAIYIKNASFYQDKLGTNIEKTQKRVA